MKQCVIRSGTLLTMVAMFGIFGEGSAAAASRRLERVSEYNGIELLNVSESDVPAGALPEPAPEEKPAEPEQQAPQQVPQSVMPDSGKATPSSEAKTVTTPPLPQKETSIDPPDDGMAGKVEANEEHPKNEKTRDSPVFSGSDHIRWRKIPKSDDFAQKVREERVSQPTPSRGERQVGKVEPRESSDELSVRRSLSSSDTSDKVAFLTLLQAPESQTQSRSEEEADELSRRSLRAAETLSAAGLVMVLPSSERPAVEAAPVEENKSRPLVPAETAVPESLPEVSGLEPMELVVTPEPEEQPVSDELPATVVDEGGNGPQAMGDPQIPTEPVKPEKTQFSELELIVVDAETGRELPAMIHISTDATAPFSVRDWSRLEMRGSYVLPAGAVRVDIDAGFDYLPEAPVLMLKQKRQSLKVEMVRWGDIRQRGWAPFQLYTFQGFSGKGVEVDPLDLKKDQMTYGCHGLGLEAPFAMRGIAGESSGIYEKMFEKSIDLHGTESTWFPAQRNLVGRVSLDILGAYRALGKAQSGSDALRLLRWAIDARRAGGVSSLFRPSEKVELEGGAGISAAALLFFSGALVDMLDIQSDADRELWFELLKLGIRLPAISSRRRAHDEFLQSNLLVAAQGTLSQQEFLEQIRAGRMLMSDGCVIDFTLNYRSGVHFAVGDVAPGVGRDLLLTSQVQISQRPVAGRGVKQFELLVNGVVRQPTPLRTALMRGQATFGEIAFEDGDFVLARMLREDGSVLLTNPVYVGSSWEKRELEPGWIRLTVVLVDRQLKPLNNVNAAIRAPGTYFEKSMPQGELDMSVPLDAEIVFDVHGSPLRTYRVLDRWTEHLVRDGVPGGSVSDQIRSLREASSPFRDVVRYEDMLGQP